MGGFVFSSNFQGPRTFSWISSRIQPIRPILADRLPAERFPYPAKLAAILQGMNERSGVLFCMIAYCGRVASAIIIHADSAGVAKR